ncbi:hypothetical protein [Paenibacillus hemerocallicola]|nr:hypothetical protein [Paenibacillus hemerocallicola]
MLLVDQTTLRGETIEVKKRVLDDRAGDKLFLYTGSIPYPTNS